MWTHGFRNGFWLKLEATDNRHPLPILHFSTHYEPVSQMCKLCIWYYLQFWKVEEILLSSLGEF